MTRRNTAASNIAQRVRLRVGVEDRVRSRLEQEVERRGEELARCRSNMKRRRKQLERELWELEIRECEEVGKNGQMNRL